MKEIKILGIIIAVPPLKNPALLLRWFLAWKRDQILGPPLRRLAEAQRRLAASVEAFTKAMKKAMKDAGMEEE